LFGAAVVFGALAAAMGNQWVDFAFRGLR